MICAFIFLLISLAAALAAPGTLIVDTRNCPTDGLSVGGLSFETCRSRHHDSECVFFVWQFRQGRLTPIALEMRISGLTKIAMSKADLDVPLFLSTTCGDGLWVDYFVWELEDNFSSANGLTYGQSNKVYGTQGNRSGFCLSTDRGDYRHFDGKVASGTCWETIELQAFNEVVPSTKGKTEGHHAIFRDVVPATRRILDSEPSANDFGAALAEYLQCVQTLGDDPACEGFSIAASELFDQDEFVELSDELDADESSEFLVDETSKDADSKDRRKL